MAGQASTLSYCVRILQEMEAVLWKAVRNVHYMIDKEIAAGALTLLTSVLLYPKTLGCGAVFSGCVPLSSSIMEQATPDVKGTPIPWLHGMADRTVLFEAGQTEPHFLEQAGISRAYPGLGQSISNEELKYLESWIKEWFFIEFWMLLDLHKCTEMGLGPLGEPRHMYGGNKSSDIMHVVVK
ncbi:phospholipase/carboxylesterase family protein [Salix suchowensis]|nr:phospholipase/carboxylesterase family protein [Salix suchowensis]